MRIAETGKPVEGFHIERSGDIETIMKASKESSRIFNVGIRETKGRMSSK
jgi:hypothetical protein